MPNLQGLTRSERLFSTMTKTNIQSLLINDSAEFFLFMDMRAEKGWASFKMNPRLWVIATNEYNLQLEALNQTKNVPTIHKNPIALVNLLGNIEPKISNRILTNNFLCKCQRLPEWPLANLTLFGQARRNDDTFWRKHCGAVPLVKVEQHDVALTNLGKPVRIILCETTLYC
jgi:hypothetical protein